MIRTLEELSINDGIRDLDGAEVIAPATVVYDFDVSGIGFEVDADLTRHKAGIEISALVGQ